MTEQNHLLPKGGASGGPGKKTWPRRNWIWLVPLALAVLFLSGAVCCGGLVYGVFSSIKSTDIYQNSLAVAQTNREAIVALGEPIKPGFLVTGSIQVNGPSGTAELGIPVSGPNGSGTVYVIARMAAGEWNYVLLQLEVDETGERIDLLSSR